MRFGTDSGSEYELHRFTSSKELKPTWRIRKIITGKAHEGRTKQHSFDRQEEVSEAKRVIDGSNWFALREEPQVVIGSRCVLMFTDGEVIVTNTVKEISL